MPSLPAHIATRYVQPLREGGSLPAVVEADDDRLYVVKFRGAGHGAKALVAELIGGMLALALDLPTPALALIHVPPPFGRSEPDPEIQEILQRSHGVNAGADYLDSAFNFDSSAAGQFIAESLASRIVWFDAFLTNPDRTHRNPNLLIWQRRAWLIDHGSALYAHHDWEAVDDARVRTPFPLIRQHVLLERTTTEGMRAADASSVARLSAPVIDEILAEVPDALLSDPTAGAPETERERYRAYLTRRLESPRAFVEEVERARAALAIEPLRPMAARR